MLLSQSHWQAIVEEALNLKHGDSVRLGSYSALSHCVMCHAPPSRDQNGSSAIVILAISPGASQIIKLMTAITL